MKKILLLGAIVMLFGLSAETYGQGNRYRGDRSRIRSGVRSGQLTRNEARQLRERRRQIRQERRVYRSDGTITRAERRDIRHDRHDLSRQIRRQRHDNDGWDYNGRRDQRRGNGYYRRGAGSPSHPVFGNGGNRGRGRH